jgi:hypothetical protein
MNTQELTRNSTTGSETLNTVNHDPLAPENLKDPLSYEDLLPYLLLPIAGCW